jgi:hypothetical protein
VIRYPNVKGHAMMANGILRAFGLSEKKLAAAEKSWGVK